MDDRNLDTLIPQPSKFRLAPMLWEQMRTHAMNRAPEEACGLVAGRIEGDVYHAVEVIPITNISHSPYRYRMDPAEQIRAFHYIEGLGLELVGIYHSHPKGPEYPSTSDIAESYYPECAYLIWSGRSPSWSCRGFAIRDQQFLEIPIDLEVE
jgi:proteasome lid subunit RPN8/RPN11